MLTFEHEIVLLKYLITGLLTLKYYSGHTAGGKELKVEKHPLSMYIYSMANIKKPSFFSQLNYLLI